MPSVQPTPLNGEGHWVDDQASQAFHVVTHPQEVGTVLAVEVAVALTVKRCVQAPSAPSVRSTAVCMAPMESPSPSC